MNTRLVALAATACLALAGCASWFGQNQVKQTGSVVEYLYPDSREPPALRPTVTALRPPVRVGIAFVPGGGFGSGLAETEKQKLLERVKASFAQAPYVDSIQVIPGSYLRAKGGFTNLEQAARLFDVEVVALLSYDQVQFADASSLSLLYWTIVGAYVIHGDHYDVQTMLDASVFDVASRKLLFRAPGTSRVKGSATMVGFSERAREARSEGYAKAVDDLVPRLQTELDAFRERAKTDRAIRVENKPGYTGGGGAFGGWAWSGGLMLAVLVLARRPARRLT